MAAVKKQKPVRADELAALHAGIDRLATLDPESTGALCVLVDHIVKQKGSMTRKGGA